MNVSDSVLSEQAFRAARDRYSHEAYRLELEAKKFDMAGYPLSADECRKKAALCRRAAAAELVNPK